MKGYLGDAWRRLLTYLPPFCPNAGCLEIACLYLVRRTTVVIACIPEPFCPFGHRIRTPHPILMPDIKMNQSITRSHWFRALLGVQKAMNVLASSKNVLECYLYACFCRQETVEDIHYTLCPLYLNLNQSRIPVMISETPKFRNDCALHWSIMFLGLLVTSLS